jgi:DNA mismatch endonuclease, patch repair protein
MKRSTGSSYVSEATRNVMRANRSSDTGPEMALRKALHARGLRFRLRVKINLGEMSVRPDVIFPRERIAVFVDGCFWHRCSLHRSIPVTNHEFWTSKMDANVARDQRADAALCNGGWSSLRVWEHEPPDDAAARIAATIGEARAVGKCLGSAQSS